MMSKNKIIFFCLILLFLALCGYFVFTPNESSENIIVLGEDGDHSGYIKKIYDKDGDKFIDVDYFQTLTGEDAVAWKLKNSDCDPQDCDSTEWVDVNDDPKIVTFQVYLQNPIIMAYLRNSQGVGMDFGFHKEIEFGKYEVSWETLRNIVSGAGYDIPFAIKVVGGKVVSIGEIYRP